MMKKKNDESVVVVVVLWGLWSGTRSEAQRLSLQRSDLVGGFFGGAKRVALCQIFAAQSCPLVAALVATPHTRTHTVAHELHQTVAPQ
jgi:hypothetical protein